MNNQYDTLQQATKQLKERGYYGNASILDESHIQLNNEKWDAKDIQIDEFHRFEGNTNPSDMSIVYALSTSTGEKGLFIDAYGPDSSRTAAQFLQKVEGFNAIA